MTDTDTAAEAAELTRWRIGRVNARDYLAARHPPMR